MLIQQPEPNQEFLKPHEYPTWLVIAVIIILAIWGHLMSFLPKAWEFREEKKSIEFMVQKADSLYNVKDYRAAIPLYKKQYYIDKGLKPIKLSLCYFNLRDDSSHYKGAALIGVSNVQIPEKEIEPYLDAPNFSPYTSCLESSTLRILGTNVTYYTINLEKLEKERPEEYQRVMLASKEFGERVK